MPKRTITIDFDTNNAAFGDEGPGLEAETMRIMGTVAGKVTAGVTNGTVVDSFGNSVGAWELTDTEE